MDEYFWDDLLAHIRQRNIVTIVGSELATVQNGDTETTLSALIGKHLASHHGLSLPPATTTMGGAVAALLQERGQDDVERLYRVISEFVRKLDPAPAGPLRN